MKRTVVTLTTSPHRMHHLRDLMNALLNQTSRPDAVYLNLPKRYRDEAPYVIPDWLSNTSEVSIQWRDNDLGPIMKLLPALEVETEPETLIITVDDDVRYPSELVSVFQEAAKTQPEAAFGSRGFNFTNQGQHLQPVRGNLVSCDVLQGYGACAYRRKHFNLEGLRRDLTSQPEMFRFSDDVLISNHIASLGVTRFTVKLEGPLQHMSWGDDDPQSLKFIDGGTHRRYAAVRAWCIEEEKWFINNQTSPDIE